MLNQHATKSLAYRIGMKFIHGLIARSSRSRWPGGFWLLGEGGLGKSFILDAAYEDYAPHESETERICPLLTLAFESRPSESDILLSLLMQLGQDPDTLRYQSNRELRDIVVDGMRASGTLAILFDETHHLWLNTRAYRVADRLGGRLGDFLKTFYDKSGAAFIFSGTPGLKALYDSYGHLWESANILRGPVDAADFKTYNWTPRFKFLRGATKPMLVGCAAVTPYAVSSAMTAAALASEMIGNWLSDDVSPRFRSRACSHGETHSIRDSSPDRLKECPACCRT